MTNKEFSVEAAVKTAIEKGKFVIPGIGTFKVVESKARVGRNPQTGESINIPARKTVKFAASTALKATLN